MSQMRATKELCVLFLRGRENELGREVWRKDTDQHSVGLRTSENPTLEWGQSSS